MASDFFVKKMWDSEQNRNDGGYIDRKEKESFHDVRLV
jgi:hypothetical protein